MEFFKVPFHILEPEERFRSQYQGACLPEQWVRDLLPSVRTLDETWCSHRKFELELAFEFSAKAVKVLPDPIRTTLYNTV